MSRDDLIFYLKRGRTTIDNYLSLMIGKELDYLYPMMVHHPRHFIDDRQGTGLSLPHDGPSSEAGVCRFGQVEGDCMTDDRATSSSRWTLRWRSALCI